MKRYIKSSADNSIFDAYINDAIHSFSSTGFELYKLGTALMNLKKSKHYEQAREIIEPVLQSTFGVGFDDAKDYLTELRWDLESITGKMNELDAEINPDNWAKYD